MNQTTLENVFKFLDSSEQGLITDEDMRKSLIRRGHIFKLSSKEPVSIEELMAQAGYSDEKTSITFPEFLTLMGVEY